jgi:hypothetical protein
MSHTTTGIQQLSRQSDPTRHFEGGEPWHTEWHYRFVPPSRLQDLDVTADHGLDYLLYFQFLISEEIEVREPALTRAQGV